MRLIDKLKLIREIHRYPVQYREVMLKVVNGQHAIDAVPVRRGKWLERGVSENGNAIDQWQSAKCSYCGRYHTTPYMYYFTEYNYCPHCGTKMVKGEDDEQND